MSEIRTANMAKRRKRILTQARALISEGGFDTLNLRDLATASDVTVPTIYNLIGNKTALLKALVTDTFADFEVKLEEQFPCPTGHVPELMMSTLVGMIAKNENFYRSSNLACISLENEAENPDNYDLKRPTLLSFARKLCRDAINEGLLRGEIDSESLIELMISNHQIAMRDWTHQMISLDEMRRQSLRGFYVGLAADAQDDFRGQLVGWLKAL